jgi:putative ribosome biogenesis GTPase RsgA
MLQTFYNLHNFLILFKSLQIAQLYILNNFDNVEADKKKSKKQKKLY